VVGARRPRRVALLVSVMAADPARGAYAGGGSAWATAASLVYEPLARHLIARFPTPLTDQRVLDTGAGTGAAGSVLAALGARVVETDLEPTMLDHARSGRPVAAAADVAALPFRSGVFDAAVAAFVLNHVADPAAGLAELARVTRRGGHVLASTFTASRSAAKVAFDDVARRHGWRPPGWHDVVSARQAAFGTIAHARAAARQARIDDVAVTEAAVDVGVDDPELIVRYRLGMPQYAAWLGELDGRGCARLVADAISAIEDVGEPFRPQVIEVVARVT
jgi:2-polyprenyl-3-methyl-5-hydroxy-6-metoxy-1,4-benzoquinol methylase